MDWLQCLRATLLGQELKGWLEFCVWSTYSVYKTSSPKKNICYTCLVGICRSAPPEDLHRNQMALASSRQAKLPSLPVIQQNDPIGTCSALDSHLYSGNKFMMTWRVIHLNHLWTLKNLFLSEANCLDSSISWERKLIMRMNNLPGPHPFNVIDTPIAFLYTIQRPRRGWQRLGRQDLRGILPAIIYIYI